MPGFRSHFEQQTRQRAGGELGFPEHGWRYTGFLKRRLFVLGLFFTLGAIFNVAVAWSRVRSGRCVACGYPLGISPVCSECGRAVEPCAAA